MHRPVCVKCEVEMRCEKTGVVVAEMYMNNEEVYKIISADKFKCPLCKVEVVVGFAEGARAEAGCDVNLDVELERLKKSGREVVYDKEVAG